MGKTEAESRDCRLGQEDSWSAPGPMLAVGDLPWTCLQAIQRRGAFHLKH